MGTAAGLEVLGLDSKWATVPHVPGSFIVMPGFCLERITNGLIQATPHRVQNHNAQKRHSSTLFLDPNASHGRATPRLCQRGEPSAVQMVCWWVPQLRALWATGIPKMSKSRFKALCDI